MTRQIMKWLKDPTPAGMLVFLTILALIAAAVILFALPAEADLQIETNGQQRGTQAITGNIEKTENEYTWLEIPFADPLPTTENITLPPAFPSRSQMVLIGRIAKGIHKVRTMNGKIPYCFCGEAHDGEDAKDLALEVAWHVVRSAWKASSKRYPVNTWGWAGLLNNEGGMDLCTLGLYPRKRAYKFGVLKKQKGNLSHTREDVLRAINHKRLKRWFKAFDLGMAQTLDSHYRAWRQYERKPWKSADLLEWKGFYWQAEYMHSLSVRHRTNRPWMYWPGHKAPWKDYRVTQHAKKMGATAAEIGPVTPGIWKKPKPKAKEI